MGSRRAYGVAQRVLNLMNQMRGVSETWSSSEAFYGQICMNLIDKHVADRGSSLKILDGGCGTGLMSIEYAAKGHDVTGIEIHKPSIDVLQGNAEKKGVTVNTIQGDLLEQLRGLPTGHFDAAMSMGVLYTCVSYREMITEFARTLKKDGLFFATFRPAFYFVTALIRQGQFDKALTVLESNEGMLRLAKTPAYYNWQTDDELLSLYGDNGLEVIEKRPVGVYSGVGYDGMAAVADTDAVDDSQRQALFQLEIAPGKISGAGRFTFVAGRKH